MKHRVHKEPRDVLGAIPALKRAAKEAREVAEATGTPLVIVEDGKIIKVNVSAKRKKKAG